MTEPTTTEINRLNISMTEVKKDINYIRQGFDEMKADVKGLKDGFIPRPEYADFKNSVTAELNQKANKEELDVYIRFFWLIAGGVIASLLNSIFGLFRINI